MIDMEMARHSLIKAANDSARMASELASKGAPALEVAALVNAATSALSVASEVITSVNWMQEEIAKKRL